MRGSEVVEEDEEEVTNVRWNGMMKHAGEWSGGAD